MLSIRSILVVASIACSCWISGSQAQSDELRLPDMGTSASEILTPQQEREIGEQMIRYFRSVSRVLDDPIVRNYVEDIGYRLAAHSDRPEHPYTFFVVAEPSINAFAAPGGFIGVHSGLILTAESESELAAVLAHEIAHVTQKHLVRRFESTQKASLPIALAMVGALIAASASSNSGDAAQAAIVGGSALMQQAFINYTRANEYEADWVGMRSLAAAGFEPEAMASFFGRMGRLNRVAGDTVPEFLRTHPVTTTRIAEARARSEQLQNRTPLSPSLRFEMVRERLRVLSAEHPLQAIARYRETLQFQQEEMTHAVRYGYALALTQAGQTAQALELLEPMQDSDQEATLFRIAYAEALEAAGETERANELFETLTQNHPGREAIIIAYAEILLRRGQLANVQRAQELLRPLVSRSEVTPATMEIFARAAADSGDEIRAAEAYAEVAFMNGRSRDALTQLTRLSKRSDLSYYQRARIDARIAVIQPLVLESQRRNSP